MQVGMMGNAIKKEILYRVEHDFSLLPTCRVYCPALYVLNKIDRITVQELDILDRIPHVVPICAFHEWNFDELLDTIWKYLDMNRVYVGVPPSSIL